MNSIRRLVLLAAALSATAGPHAEDAYPSRPITFVVPFSPGSTTDIAARAVASSPSSFATMNARRPKPRHTV